MFPAFTPWSALLGGALIGAAASVLLLLHGRVAGISGIVGGLFSPRPGDIGWRVAFLAGLASAGVGATLFAPQSLVAEIPRAPWMLVLAGLLVGVGTRLGNGCTSGHGVCGLSRASPRSLAAVLTFMLTGIAVAVALGRLTGVSP